MPLLAVAKTVGKNWGKKLLTHHKDRAVMHSRCLDHSRAQYNNPTLIQEFLDLYNPTCNEHNIETENKYNMDEKGYLVSVHLPELLLHKNSGIGSLLTTEIGKQLPR